MISEKYCHVLRISVYIYEIILFYQVKIMLSPKTKYQIAQELGISLRTLQRWIKKSDLEVPRGLICPHKQKEIFEKFGFASQGIKNNIDVS